MTKTAQKDGRAIRPLAQDRLILSLDMPVSESRELVRKLGDLVRVVKINYLHFLEISTRTEPNVRDFLSFLAQRDIDVFFDLKFYDIRNTVESYIRALSKTENVRFCTIHGSSSLIEAALRGKNGRRKPRILVVTLLTSLDEKDLKDIYNIEGSRSIKDHVIRRARQAYDHGSDGVVASGKHAGLIKKAIGTDLEGKKDEEFVVVSPGIRLNESPDDHKRTTTPEEAVENGSDYLVIGRPIYKSDDPVRTTKDILDRMQKAFDRKAEGKTIQEGP